MRWRVMIRTVIVQRLRLLHLSHSHVLLQLFLLHIVLELLVETVKAMDEFVLAWMHRSTLRTKLHLMHILLLSVDVLIVLIREVVVVLLTADRVIVVGVDLDVLQTLTAQR